MPKISEVMKQSTQEINNRNDQIEQLLSHGGYGIIGADRDMGKTNEALHLICMFASNGGATYHGLKVNPCKVLYINFEDNPIKMASIPLQHVTCQKELKIMRENRKLSDITVVEFIAIVSEIIQREQKITREIMTATFDEFYKLHMSEPCFRRTKKSDFSNKS